MNTFALHETLSGSPSSRAGNPHLVSASGHTLKHYGEQSVPMKLHDGRKISITFQVCEVKGPTMSVGKFCTKENDRMRDVHDTWWCLVARRCWRWWWAEFETSTSGNAGSNQETCWHQCKLAAPVEAQVNLRDIVRQSHKELMLRY